MNKFQKEIDKFSKDRNWDQFHNPKDLLLGIVEEIGEFRNIIKWEQDPQKIRQVLKEKNVEVDDTIGDILWFLSLLANQSNIDIDKSLSRVIDANKKRFPITKTRNRHTNVNIGGHDGRK